MSNLPDGWKKYPLSELYDFRSGLSKPRSEFGFGYGFLSFKDVFYNFFVPDKLSELVNSTEKERKSCSIKKGDVFLTRTSETMDELGMSCVALKDYEGATFNGFTKRLRPKTNIQIIPEYAGYFFRSPKFRNEITAMSSLCTRASLNNEMLGRLKIILPSKEEQSAIGYILKSLDDKIELNQQMNQTLEAMARAIFKSWFVDFDPVRAKMEGKQPVGMDTATANLFPDSFEESELGLIPRGWRVEELGNLAQNFSKTFDFSQHESVIFINTGDVLSGNFLHSNLVSKDGLPGQAKKSIYKNDILLSEIRPANQRYAFVDFDTNNYVVSTKFMIIRAFDIIEPRLLYRILTLQSSLAEFQIVAESRSGTFPQITFNSISYFPIILAPKSIQISFLNLIYPFEKQIKQNTLQSETLANIRDTLLPKLMSGEIRVKEAERMIEEVV